MVDFDRDSVREKDIKGMLDAAKLMFENQQNPRDVHVSFFMTPDEAAEVMVYLSKLRAEKNVR